MKAAMQRYFQLVALCTVLTFFLALVLLDWNSGTIPVRPTERANDSRTPSPNDRKDYLDWLTRSKHAKQHPNVLFIIADDMRPEIGAYIHEHSPWLASEIKTPNLDAFAKGSILFRRAYCQISWCNPSRSSLLTSRRPDTTMVHNNSVYFRQNNPNFVTLPQYFKEHGYHTQGMGKIFHLMNLIGDHDDEYSWSEPMYRPNANQMFTDGPKVWGAVSDKDRDGKLLLDETVIRFAIETLSDLAEKQKSDDHKPFFLAVGLKKPHLNWYFPERFLKYYPLENISVPENPTISKSVPEIAWFNSFEVRGREEYKNETDIWTMTEPLADWVTKELRRAYYSSISYIDDLVGQLLNHLSKLNLVNNTIVSFVGDHGFHLGEHAIFGKNTVFEVANNVPMMLHIPGVPSNGATIDKLVEFVDLFPTLAELAGLPQVPYCPPGLKSRSVNLCTEGTSLVPLLKDQVSAVWKDSIFYQYPHYLSHVDLFCMGYSIRTPRYRYTEWVDYNYNIDVPANWTHLCGKELYDHYSDPHETNNLAEDENMAATVSSLSLLLKAGWHAALPNKK